MDPDELKAWLRLLLSPGLGRPAARQLLQALGSAQAVFEASAADWQALGLQRIQPHRVVAQQGQQTASGRCRGVQRQRDLRLAMVGSRNPTPQGERNAREFAQALAGRGGCVGAGLALGIDGAAHAGALDGGGTTIAVVGTGLDQVYPRRHQALAQRIAGHGLLLSELALGAPPLSHHFPQRNRLIAGLAQATLVVEANLQSGSLITARLAAEQGKEVLAIPGSIHSPQSRGCHLLIQQGARLVGAVQDVLDELQWARPWSEAPPAAPAQADSEAGPERDAPAHPLLQALGWEAMDLDSLQQRCGWPTEQLQAQLLALELDGLVAHLPGGRFQRLARA